MTFVQPSGVAGHQHIDADGHAAILAAKNRAQDLPANTLTLQVRRQVEVLDPRAFGFSDVAGLSGLLGQDLRLLRATHPGIEVELVEAAPAALADHLRAGVVDVVYAPDLGDTTGLVSWERATVHPVIAVTDDHAFAGIESVRLADLVNEPLIAFASEHDAWATTLLAEVTPERLRSATSTLGVLALVSAGVGVAVVPSVLQCVAMPGVSYVPLERAGEIAVVTAIRRGEPTPPVRELLLVNGHSSTLQ